MGEITDMMLDGTLCIRCGVLMEDLIPENNGDDLLDSPGYSRLCAGCKQEDEE